MSVERTRAWTVPLLVVALAAGVAPGQESGGGDVHFRHGHWTLKTPLGDARGAMAVLQAPDGRWRCDVVVEGDGGAASADVLRRQGQGWTLTGSEAGGVVQPWGEPWRTTGPALSLALGAILVEWSGSEQPLGDAAMRPRRWRLAATGLPRTVVVPDWDDLPAAWRPEGGRDPGGSALKRRLTGRGRGRGDAGGVLRLDPRDDGLHVTSTRLPGSLLLDWPDGGATDVPDEAFLPLWPLADLLP